MCPTGSVVPPCDPGAALRDVCTSSRPQGSARRARLPAPPPATRSSRPRRNMERRHGANGPLRNPGKNRFQNASTPLTPCRHQSYSRVRLIGCRRHTRMYSPFRPRNYLCSSCWCGTNSRMVCSWSRYPRDGSSEAGSTSRSVGWKRRVASRLDSTSRRQAPADFPVGCMRRHLSADACSLHGAVKPTEGGFRPSMRSRLTSTSSPP
jgi:hypothetical protein